MGNLPCSGEDLVQLVPLAQDFCPFPNYNPSLVFFNMLSTNSSVHLKDHYTAVQSSLTPTQLEDFTKRLRTTFGREGKVTHGGFGFVALSLAVLFDTLARKVKGEHVSHQEVIPGLFFEDLSGSYPPPIHTVSKYLRTVPRIANNPARMRLETERYLKQLITEIPPYQEQLKRQADPEDITYINTGQLEIFLNIGRMYLDFLTNGTVQLEKLKIKDSENVTYNLNCDPEVASAAFKAEIQKSDQRTQEAFTSCFPPTEDIEKSVLQDIVENFYQRTIIGFGFILGRLTDDPLEEIKDFDLKAHALGKWA